MQRGTYARRGRAALGAAALGAAALTFTGTPGASAAPNDTAPVSQAAVGASLKGQDLARWKALTASEQRTTTAILSDPEFGLPSAAARLAGKYPQLKVSRSSSDVADSPSTNVALASVYYASRTTSVSQNWTILGVTYTRITTTMGYHVSGATVIDVTRCTNAYTNWIPARSVNASSWSTLGNGLADCWTEWTLDRPFQATQVGYQGLRVNGYGTILKIWYV